MAHIELSKNLGCILTSDSGPTCQFISVIKLTDHVLVGNGRMSDGREAIIKLYQSRYHTTWNEILKYRKFSKSISPFPWFYDDFKYLGISVLVMEKLTPLSDQDNVNQIGIDVLNILKVIHQYGIHNGIKPDNIMRNKDGRFILIDYGSIATERANEYGFIRKSWSPKWTCQKRGKSNQITTPLHDFIELGTTLNHLGLNFKNWKRYISYCDSLCRCCIDSDDYDKLIECLS